jgi:hypothetical protein
VPRGVLWQVLAKMGVPPHLKMTFDLNGEPVEVLFGPSRNFAKFFAKMAIF